MLASQRLVQPLDRTYGVYKNLAGEGGLREDSGADNDDVLLQILQLANQSIRLSLSSFKLGYHPLRWLV